MTDDAAIEIDIPLSCILAQSATMQFRAGCFRENSKRNVSNFQHYVINSSHNENTAYEHTV